MPESTPFKHENADDSPGFLLWKLTTRWQALLDGVFAGFGITQTQYAILASLRWFEHAQEPPTQARLVAHTHIDKMTLSKAIRKLEEMQLVARSPSATDTRAVQVGFTEAGRQLIHAAILAVERTDDAFFSRLDSGQQAQWKQLTRCLLTTGAL